MEQRFYHGNIDPNGLADYLVGMFGQGYAGRVTAQKVGQGEHLLVQVGRVRTSGRIRNAIGVSIARTPDGVSVSTGQSNWLDDRVIDCTRRLLRPLWGGQRRGERNMRRLWLSLVRGTTTAAAGSAIPTTGILHVRTQYGGLSQVWAYRRCGKFL